jgi:sodium-dependent dicarboxylate transporter 2/3/5
MIIMSHPVVLLVIGCMLAHVIIKNDIHLVIATYLMKTAKPQSEFSIVILMMLISAFLSMWVSNTSAVAMLIPVTLNLAKRLNIPTQQVLLSIAYGATMGGMLTPIGTPANLVAIDYASRYFDIEINFMSWMIWALPFVTLLSLSLSFYFWRTCSQERFKLEQQALQIDRSQKIIIMLLATCVLLWATGSAPFGGWAALVGRSVPEEYTGMLVLFCISFISYKNQPAIALTDIKKLPFSSILMVVAGIYMAEALMHTGMLSIVTQALLDNITLSSYQSLVLFGVLISVLTEICSNTAITALGLPLTSIMMNVSHLEILPCILLITFSANSAFMLPTATPPNALVLGTGAVSSKHMFTVGLVASIISLIVLIILIQYIY